MFKRAAKPNPPRANGVPGLALRELSADCRCGTGLPSTLSHGTPFRNDLARPGGAGSALGRTVSLRGSPLITPGRSEPGDALEDLFFHPRLRRDAPSLRLMLPPGCSLLPGRKQPTAGPEFEGPAAGFSYMTLSRPRPALRILAELPNLLPPIPPNKERAERKGRAEKRVQSVWPARSPTPPSPPMRTQTPCRPHLNSLIILHEASGAPSSGSVGALALRSLRGGRRSLPLGRLLGPLPSRARSCLEEVRASAVLAFGHSMRAQVAPPWPGAL